MSKLTTETPKEISMSRFKFAVLSLVGPAVLAVLPALVAPMAEGACCYFSAKDADILQPAQKAFLTWDPVKKVETFTAQPKFEGNALDFGMVIPTPSRPKLHEMPKDFFKNLAIYTILKKREFPQSKLMAVPDEKIRIVVIEAIDPGQLRDLTKSIKVLESGVVGSLDYKVIEASRADDLFQWLKDNKYSYSGDEATLDFYVKKKWVFTVMKIDTMQMKKNKDGSYAGEVTPTRFSFSTDKLVYPLKITQISVKDKTEALFYVQAPFKVDLPGDLSFQHTWIPMLKGAQGCTPGGIKGGGEEWLKATDQQIPAIFQRNGVLGFNFIPGQRPQPNARGITPTTMEWARRLTRDDIDILTGKVAYCEKVPDVDEGFTQADLKDQQKREAVYKIIRARLEKARQNHPYGYLVRHVPAADIARLRTLTGHLQVGLFVTKFRHIFTRGEMNDDLVLVPARLGNDEDTSEYTEQLPSSPP
jgi:hypothetical protein